MTYIWAMAVSGLLSIVFFFMPATVAGCWAMVVLQIVISAAAGITFPLLWSMYAAVADYSELKHGHGSTGLIFSSSSMAQKFGGAFGSALILWLLASYGYDTSGAAVQNGEAIFGLRMLMSWLPAAGCALAVLLAVLVAAVAVLGWSEGRGALAALGAVCVYYCVLWLFRHKIEHTIHFSITKHY